MLYIHKIAFHDEQTDRQTLCIKTMKYSVELVWMNCSLFCKGVWVGEVNAIRMTHSKGHLFDPHLSPQLRKETHGPDEYRNPWWNSSQSTVSDDELLGSWWNSLQPTVWDYEPFASWWNSLQPTVWDKEPFASWSSRLLPKCGQHSQIIHIWHDLC